MCLLVFIFRFAMTTAKRGTATTQAGHASAVTPAKRPRLSPDSGEDVTAGRGCRQIAKLAPLVPAQGNVAVVVEPVCDDASAATYMQGVVPAVLQLLPQLRDATGTPQPTGEPWK